jgi:hypothetical protein
LFTLSSTKHIWTRFIAPIEETGAAYASKIKATILPKATQNLEHAFCFANKGNPNHPHNKSTIIQAEKW